MTTRVKTTLWLLLVLASGATGFYLGFGKGAKVMGSMADQNLIFDAFHSINSSLSALDQNDLAHSQRQHQINLRIGLYALANLENVGYKNCNDESLRTLQGAKNYLATHQGIDILRFNFELTKAFQFCGAKYGNRGARHGL